MLLTVTCEAEKATDLGYLLHKHPERVHSRELPFGTARVFYPEATDERCAVALLLELDPVELVRSGQGFRGLDQYVNDRPYVASSFFSVAMARMFATALSKRSRERPERVDEKMSLEAMVAVVRCREGEELIRRCFDPLGYEVEAERLPLDERLGELGESPLFRLTLRGRQTVADLLAHIYVILPVLDDDKHYYVGEQEIDKLLRRGEGWLSQHPDHELITRRYLRYRQHLTEEALTRLAVDEEPLTTDVDEEESPPGAPLRLNELRLSKVAEVLTDPSRGARRVIDLGCGGAKLLKKLLAARQLDELVGMDVSPWALRRAGRFLMLDRMPPKQRARISLMQGSLLYQDRRLGGFDAAAMVEVIEHLPESRLDDMARIVFGQAKPGMVVVTTPNAEHNVRFEGLAEGAHRHRDHFFEWTRAEFGEWAERIGDRFGYEVELMGIGVDDDEVGPPTQMAIFRARQGVSDGNE
ncbi:MAG TPA: 3' terminal RNA ribose 2'-O-methyltransferase Hen1 [Armatimonadota bacterium]|nr:3' terminal RNA ribose 2'-O-methyltransferase Hen1 [Armatimonadota bacterium]